ncbi:DMT family transporter [Pelagibacterium montanilacus]|uniref:DMT family transporter n=1 Tax=Pelagibacterium montanilacus TaxID=2185280 RepID=UPI00319E5965
MSDPKRSPSAPDRPSLSQVQPRVMIGIGLKVASVFVMVAMSSMIKAAEGVPVGQIVFFRSFFALVPMVAFLAWQGQLRDGLKTSRPGSHVLRGLIGVSGMWLIFFALTRLPLPEAITIHYATPLFIVVFSALFMGEQIRLFRWSAVIVGLIGVIIVMWPRLTVFSGDLSEMGPETVGALAAFTACITAAVAMLMVRRLVFTERSATIVIYFSLVSTATGLISIPFGWVPLSAGEATLLISAGIAGGVGQILMTESYRHADMSTIAPFEYSSMILAVAIGYLVFSEVPTPQMLIGGTIVVGAGIFIIYRESRLGIDHSSARRTTSPH